MFGIKAKITRCVDDSGYPSFVECQFVDVNEKIQTFVDKDAIFTTENLDSKSKYPTVGIIGCVILERKTFGDREILKVSTEMPWHIESTNGKTIFEILAEQVIEFERLGK